MSYIRSYGVYKYIYIRARVCAYVCVFMFVYLCVCVFVRLCVCVCKSEMCAFSGTAMLVVVSCQIRFKTNVIFILFCCLTILMFCTKCLTVKLINIIVNTYLLTMYVYTLKLITITITLYWVHWIFIIFFFQFNLLNSLL